MNYGSRLELPTEPSKLNRSHTEDEDSKLLNSQYLKTTNYEDASPMNSSFLKVSHNTSGEIHPKVTQLMSRKPSQEGGFRQKLESILQGQNFSHTSLSPTKRKSRRQLSEDEEAERITKISNRVDSSPTMHTEEVSYQLVSNKDLSLIKQQPKNNEKVVPKEPPRNFVNRSKSLAKDYSISLYDENNKLALFPKAHDKKPKRLRTLEPIKLKPKERVNTEMSSNDSLLSRLTGRKIPSILPKGQQKFLYSQSPPKVRPNYVKEYLNRDNTEYKAPFLERLMTKNFRKDTQETSFSYLSSHPKERDDLKDAIRIRRMGSDNYKNSGLSFMGLVETKSIAIKFRNAVKAKKSNKNGSL